MACPAALVSATLAVMALLFNPPPVVPAVQAAACVPGGVAAIPLVRRNQAERWPSSVTVTIGELSTRAAVVWLGTQRPAARYWVQSSDQIDVRAIADAPPDAPPESTGTVLALVELPTIAGPLQVEGISVDANWILERPLPTTGSGVMPWPLEPRLDLPDLATPSEYWRWCLIAERRGERPPPPRGTLAERLWARHVSALWLAGLERVRGASRSVHAELVDALIGTAVDARLPPPGHVAAWIARADELRALLGVLLDSSTRPEQLAQSSLSWVRSSWPVTVWVEADAGDRVRLVIANPTGSEHVLRVTWVGVQDTVPVALVAPHHTVSRHWVDRPFLPASDDVVQFNRMQPEQMELALNDLRRPLSVGPREYAVRPPGLSFGTLAPPLSLADAQSGRMVPTPVEWRTTASVRRRLSRWEIIVECMCPPPDAEGAAHGDPRDEVTVRIGDPESPVRVVRVSAAGALAVDGGLTNGASAGFMQWPDRWRARIELPDLWLPAAAPGMHGVTARPAMLAIERTPGRGQPRQTGGLAVPPWVRVPPPVLVDLGAWSEVAPRGVSREPLR